MPRKVPLPPERIAHGTNAGYNDGCRLECCVEAHRVYHRWYARRRAGKIPREVSGPTEIVTSAVSIDELDVWTARAEKLGISRAALIRRHVNEGIQLEVALERQRERELAEPLLTHGG